MDTLDQNENTNNHVSERSIRNLTSSATWIIITSACGIVTGLYFLFVATMMTGSRRFEMVGGIVLIFAFIITALHIVGLTYGVGLSKIKMYSAEEMEKASAKQNAYWIFAGIAYIIWTLLLLMGIANGGGMRF